MASLFADKGPVGDFWGSSGGAGGHRGGGRLAAVEGSGVADRQVGGGRRHHASPYTTFLSCDCRVSFPSDGSVPNKAKRTSSLLVFAGGQANGDEKTGTPTEDVTDKDGDAGPSEPPVSSMSAEDAKGTCSVKENNTCTSKKLSILLGLLRQKAVSFKGSDLWPVSMDLLFFCACLLVGYFAQKGNDYATTFVDVLGKTNKVYKPALDFLKYTAGRKNSSIEERPGWWIRKANEGIKTSICRCKYESLWN